MTFTIASCVRSQLNERIERSNAWRDAFSVASYSQRASKQAFAINFCRRTLHKQAFYRIECWLKNSLIHIKWRRMLRAGDWVPDLTQNSFTWWEKRSESRYPHGRKVFRTFFVKVRERLLERSLTIGFKSTKTAEYVECVSCYLHYGSACYVQTRVFDY